MLRLTTLGALDLRDRLGHPVREVLAQPKRLALLVYLALEGRRGPVSRDRLLAIFWPESDDTHARNTLSQALHHLRLALGPELIESQGANAIVMHLETLWCDALVFGDALERGDTELALDLYRGEFCPALSVSGAPDSDEWLGAQRLALRRQALAAARALAERKAETGDAAGAARAARRAMALQPDDEADARAMLALLERVGDAAGALTAYHEFARRLAAELELDPAPETVALVDAIRRRREQAATAVSGSGGGAAAPGLTAGDAVASAGPGSRSGRWTPRRGAVAALLVLAALAGALVLRPGAAPPTAAASKGVTVFPFTVRGGPALAYLGAGMVDLLSANLEGVAGFHASDPRSVVAALTAQQVTGPISPGTAEHTARALGAAWYISGDVVEVAGRIQIRATLTDLGSPARPATSASVTGDTTALFEMVDALTGRLLVGFGGGRDTSLTRLASVTTRSLPALKAFLVGEQAMRAGHDGAAAEAFREAVALDTTFALAQYRLAMSATWVSVAKVGVSNETIAAMADAAARHGTRLTPLVRDLLAAYAAYKQVRADEAERAYLHVTESHPDNVEAWFMLGETWFHYNGLRGRSPSEAKSAFLRVLSLDPTNAHAIVHLARLAALEGRDGELDSLGRDYLARYRDTERALEMRTLLAARRHDPVEHAAIVRDALGADPIVLASVLQAALIYGQDLDLARSLAAPFLRLSRDPLSTRNGLVLFTDLELAAGRWSRRPALELTGGLLDEDWLLESRALLAACPALPISPARVRALRDTVAAMPRYPALGRPGVPVDPVHAQVMQAYLVGLLSARLGDTAQVATQIAVIGTLPGGERGVRRALQAVLRAEQARRAGDLSRARVVFGQFDFSLWSVFGHWGAHERFLMAEILRGLGRHEEALEWYQSYPGGFDGPWVALAHLRSAQIHQRLGNTERARFHYQRFISLWSGADPEFQPMVAQARAALAALGGAPSLQR